MATADDAPAPAPWSLDLTFHDVGIGIGNTKHVDGLRLNFRDAAPYVVHGIAASVWTPQEGAPAGGGVYGVVVGLPLAEPHEVRGLGVGVGVGATTDFGGLGVALLGAGAGGRARGIFLAGLGAGSGGGIDGIAIAGLGAGTGGDVRGIAVGGLGAGAGGSVNGLVAGLAGAGAGGDLKGFALGGLGAGAGGDVDGLLFGGLGAGAGRRIRGIAIGGLGVGAGEAIEGLAVAVVGVGAPRVRGIAAALAVGGKDVGGVVLAPAYHRIEAGGRFTGIAASAYNDIRGEQRGLVVGIFNYATSLQGVQLGLLNWAGNNPDGLKLLPIANAHL
jgi:hypothetical protein